MVDWPGAWLVCGSGPRHHTSSPSPYLLLTTTYYLLLLTTYYLLLSWFCVSTLYRILRTEISWTRTDQHPHLSQLKLAWLGATKWNWHFILKNTLGTFWSAKLRIISWLPRSVIHWHLAGPPLVSQYQHHLLTYYLLLNFKQQQQNYLHTQLGVSELLYLEKESLLKNYANNHRSFRKLTIYAETEM